MQNLGKSVLYPTRQFKNKIRKIPERGGRRDTKAGNELMRNPKICCRWKKEEPELAFPLVTSPSTDPEASVKS